MRVVFDALASTSESGGMKLHSTQLVSAWTRSYPQDEVTVISGGWARRVFAEASGVVTWKNESIVGRSIGQLVAAPLIALGSRSDALISLSPIVSPFVPRLTTVCFQHDWRHKKHPAQFPMAQRLYRKLWEVSAGRADMNVCISVKAETETKQIVAGARTRVIENGRDHARDWAPRERELAASSITTFGHHNNKRPELVIRALGAMTESQQALHTITVLGAKGDYATSLRDLAAEVAPHARANFPGFVSDAEYQRIVSTSSVIVMASSDEGFGLPVAEAEYLGIPAVVTSDSGMAEVFGAYPEIAEPNPFSVKGAIERALATPRSSRRAHVRTWEDAARELRTAVLDLNAK